VTGSADDPLLRAQLLLRARLNAVTMLRERAQVLGADTSSAGQVHCDDLADVSAVLDAAQRALAVQAKLINVVTDAGDSYDSVMSALRAVLAFSDEIQRVDTLKDAGFDSSGERQ
jgi:hypothetical protein